MVLGVVGMTETDVKPGLSRPELWASIRDAKLPCAIVPETSLSQSNFLGFIALLQDTHNLTEESARRLEHEYRRFLYLKAVDGGLLAPSKRVDQAWHLHLESYGDAWDRFCREVLPGQQLEHRTGLSPDEAESAAARTRDLYRKEFDEEPPHDIWPGDAEKRRGKRARQLAAWGVPLAILGCFLITTNDGGSLTGISLAIARGLGAVLFLGGILMATIAAVLYRGTDLTQASNCG